jgi:adenylate cyclase
MPRRFRLSLVLAASFGTLVLLATTVVLVFEWRLAARMTLEWLNERSIRAVDELERGVASRLEPARQMIDELAVQFIEGDLDFAARERVGLALRGALSGHPQLNAIIAISPDLREVVADRVEGGALRVRHEGAQAGRPLREWLEGARARPDTHWGDVVYAAAAGEPVVNLRRAVYRGEDLLGYLGASVTVGQLSSLLGELAAGGWATPFIIYGHEKVLAHPALAGGGSQAEPRTELPGLKEVGDDVLARLGSGKAVDAFGRIGGQGIEARQIAIGGQTSIALLKNLGSYGDATWTVGLWMPGTVVRSAVQPLYNGAYIGLLLVVVAVLLALLIGRRLALPIRATTEGAARISALEAGGVTPLPPSPIRELDDQAKAFNAMLVTIRAFETYVPRSLVHRLIRTGSLDAIRSAERDLTVMFTDIAGFTRLSERMPAIEVADLLNAHFDLVAACVEAEGGTVDKFLGDGLMAFWGAPERLKQRAVAACRAALAIRAAVTADNARRVAAGEPPLPLRIGIHRGRLVVGNIGPPGRINYTVVGDAANVAQRLEQAGREVMREDGVSIVVSAAVVSHTGRRFVFSPLGTIAMRGRDEPVQAFELLREQDGPAAGPAAVAASPHAAPPHKAPPHKA